MMSCPVKGCEEPGVGMCLGCWGEIPKTWRKWYARAPSEELRKRRLAVLIHACFEAGNRWGDLSEDAREDVILYCLRVVREKWQQERVDCDDAEAACVRYAEGDEEWKVQACWPAVRLYLTTPSGSYLSAYAHNVEAIEEVMQTIRRLGSD